MRTSGLHAILRNYLGSSDHFIELAQCCWHLAPWETKVSFTNIKRFSKIEIYQLQERKLIIKWYHQNHTVRRIKELFTETFADRPAPSIATVHKIITKFEEHGCVC